MPTPQRIREHGWRQGSVLPSDLAKRVAAPHFPEWGPDDRAVLVSQDCDVVHGSYEAEPSVELIRARISDAPNAVIRHGRNPRRLQLEGAQAGFVDVSIHDRWIIPRTELESHPPDTEAAITGDALHVLVDWIAKRYTRAAFPDAFNDRLAKSNKKIEKELKKNGELITGLFLAIVPNDECAADESYKVGLRVTATPKTLTDPDNELALLRTTKLIAEAIAACNGLDVVDYALVSEASFSLADLQYFRRWDWDYRSHSGEPGGDIAPNG